MTVILRNLKGTGDYLPREQGYDRKTGKEYKMRMNELGDFLFNMNTSR